MTPKRLIIALTALCVAGAGAVSLAAQQPQSQKGKAICEFQQVVEFPLQVTFVKPKELKKTNFGPISFSHMTHAEVACTTCHHTWDGKSNVQSCSDEGCHDNYDGKSGSVSYFNAFHKRDSESSCVGCHAKNAGKIAAKSKKPVTLMPCHNNSCHALPKK